MIKEVIVVEGRDDLIAVKNALDCEVVVTHGFGFGEKLLDELVELHKRNGLIILTDPDYAGTMIRKKITERIPGAKQAFIEQKSAIKNGDIGVENASGKEIRRAIEKARPEVHSPTELYTRNDLEKLGLMGGSSSSRKRDYLTELLKIGHANGKQLHKKLNAFQVSREEFVQAMDKVTEKYGE